MTGTAAASVACALAAAVLFAAGSVAQHHAATTTGPLLTSLIRSPRWWAGLLGDGGGYALQVAALALGAILVVQPLLVTSLLFALPMSAYLTGRWPTRTTWLLAAGLCTALAVFLIVGNPTAGSGNPDDARWSWPLAGALTVTAATAAIGAVARTPGARALALGAAGGTLFGVAAALTAHVADLITRGVPTVLGSWQTWMLCTTGLAGYYLQQRAFHAGPLTASLPALTVAEPLTAVALGITALGEHLDTDGPHLILVLAAVGVLLATTVALSRRSAADDAAVTPGTAPPPGNPTPE
ncbi:DMT family transporter [Rhodococcus yananensis]|uniref:DMT family transporter n=1 Tax=Rhodococcus yananensis TaxID=2879464 RepID=UPI003EB8F692